MTGTKAHRPQLDVLRTLLRTGDVVVVESLSRIGRSTKNLLELMQEFESKEVAFVSLKENIDLSTPTGKLIMTVLSAIAQFERDIIVQRTEEGLASARARGHVGGRPATDPKKLEKAIKLYESNIYSVTEICKLTGISKSTLYKAIKDNK